MKPFLSAHRLALVGGLGALTGGLWWLMFVLGGTHAAVHRLAEVEGARLDVIAAADPALGVQDVAALADAAWQPWTAHGYLSAPHGRVIWLRVQLRNAGADSVKGIVADTSYFSDQVDAWWPDATGGWRHAQSGDAVPGALKPLWSRTAAFPVEVPAHGERRIYLRVSDGYIPHVQPTWWAREEDFMSDLVRSIVAECLCFGALAALVFYNLVLWVRLRFADMGFYVLSAGASAACNFLSNGGLSLLGLPSGSPGHEMSMAAAFALSGLCMLEFTRVFLGTAGLLPRTDRWLRRWRAMLAAGALIVLAMPWMNSPVWLLVVALAAMLTEAAGVVIAIVAWSRGVRHARYFVLAFALVLVAIVPGMITVLRGDVLPGTALGLLAGRTLEMILLSFAVGDRFARTQQQLVEETEQRRAIEEAYADELETEVRERTRELAEANVDKDRMLAVIGHDLRSPLTGLMKSADETAGDFARETARTGRALLLLIEDLVLWARMRAGTREVAAHPARALLAPAIALHRALAQQGGTELVLDVPEELRVETDLVLAQTLVRNLLANALKFARTRVVLRAAADAAGAVRFSVSNDGPSLPPAVVTRLAQNQDEPMTAIGGLGLRLCREICAALGMRLAAHVPHGGGAEFAFTLRAAPALTPEEIA